MWMKKHARDRLIGAMSPVPTQIVSNEEFVPMRQSYDQRRVEYRIDQLAEAYAKKLGMSRRAFLKTSGGMATAFIAMNEVFGTAFTVSVAEAMESDAYTETWPKDQFIFDAQTHHVKDSIPGPQMFRKMTAKLGLNPELEGIDPGPDTLHRANFLKEIFFDSDTVMAVMTGAAIGKPEHYALPSDEMVRTRNLFNEAAGSQRMLSQGLANPVPAEGYDPMEDTEFQITELKIDGWKCYTGNPAAFWNLDDEVIAYPFWEKSLELGIRNISIHKGLPLGKRSEPYVHPGDVVKAARDFPELNFILYHSGMKQMAAPELKEGETGIGEDGYIAWTTDLCRMRDENPWMTNVYPELGAVFGHSVITHPDLCGHLLGQLIRSFGADHVIWGTDCIWWGSPQWLIEAFRRFQIPEQLQEQFGYAPITDADRNLIFGPNLAGLYGVDVDAARLAFPGDSISQMKSAYLYEGAEPSNTAYGWVRV